MAFALHFLKEKDLFLDVGANVGTFTILASGAAGARSLAIEPVPSTYARLLDNIHLNNISKKVTTMNLALGEKSGELCFTASLDTVNHVATDQEVGVDLIRVPVSTLDIVLQGLKPALIKIDVEGYETLVLAGGENVLAQDTLLGVIMELNGSGTRYGFSEVELHQRMLDHGFNTFAYSPLDRRLIPLEGKNSQSGNTLYLRHADAVMARVKTAKRFTVHQSGKTI